MLVLPALHIIEVDYHFSAFRNGQKADLSTEVRAQIHALRLEGLSQRAISARLHIP